MSDFDVRVAGLSRARRLKRRYEGVLSLHNPDLPGFRRLRIHRDPQPRHLTLLFDDIEDTRLSTRGWQAPTADHVAQALSFARALESSLLVHCHAGVSRSGAMALAVLADRLGPGQEEEAMRRLMETRPCAVPNGLVVALADQLLERGGALLDLYDRELAARPDWRWRKKLQGEVFERHGSGDFVAHHRCR